ncbi:hypothetical protein [Klebsiella phage Kpn6N]|uniref:Phage tail fibre adhesin Gp38 N-terminal domain-containing protein n=1 Tax=Klebsiella phage Phi_KR1 TaxID=3240396 RepID=A0AB39U0A3_9CAUD|nr:hypothetical protein [Klebsiella phage Kpn6N]
MAVTGPWVGSSAKATTGERWMKEAGAKLRLGTPFWMSNMIGRNVWNASITISGNNPATGPRVRGAWKDKNSASWNVLLDARGSLSGIWETGFNLVAFGLSEPSKTTGYNDAIVLEGSGNFNVNWRVDTEDGNQFHFNSSRDHRGRRCYSCTDNNAFWNWLYANDGRTFQLSFTAY